ncbi:hypothetical protein BDV23DRAFT_63542 [Aspergillus alliaceus]|uniref:DUF4211 domain-containing protein n=1 Tax=Petromyces alliaceus TaxID=209559 RepID=A0A5N7CCZ0_PETAA|nr:hypothetical protein BDV23DRAFT_63542 [Aspergillus alliaceus]
MPRTYGKAKQTRLAFAPIALPPDFAENVGEKSDQKANLRYGHPSRPTLRSGRSQLTDKSGERMSPAPFVVKKRSSDEENRIAKQEPSEKSTRKKKKKEKKEKKKKKSEGEPPQPSTSDTKVLAREDSESDDEVPTSARKVSGSRTLKRKRYQTPSDTVHSPSQNPSSSAKSEDSDADDVVARPRRKLRRGLASQSPIALEDDSDEGPIATPARRRRNISESELPRTPEFNVDQDELDLREDLQDLQDSVVKETRTRGRLANSARAQRQHHLETLRRRRAGRKESDDEESKDEQSASELEDEDGSESEAESSTRKPRSRLQDEDSDIESSIPSDEDLDRYEDDFVLEDGNLGAPAGQEMPFEFTRHAYKQPKEYFQDAVEWMVFNKLDPAFARSSPVYQVAFKKLDDEVKGRTGSQLVSSVWNADFRRALMARPHVDITGYSTLENHPCDACKRSGHPASSDIKFYGKAYSLETLEPLSGENSEDESNDAENDGKEKDRDGHVLLDENTRFLLGRHCKNKATMAHTLIHWRFHLNEWVVGYLEHMNYLTDEQVLRRSHWSERKRSKYARETVGMMVFEGEVKKLWRDFHINLRAARESMTLG